MAGEPWDGPHEGSDAGAAGPDRSASHRPGDPARDGGRSTLLLLPVDLPAVAVVALAVLWLTLPEPMALESGWPGTTAYMELRQEQAREGGRPAGLSLEPVPLAAIPRPVRRAVIVAEDAAFWRHGGVDWSEVRAAVTEWWREDERLRGASTLTMQLARNLYLSPERSWLRKARETLLAWRLEARLPKSRILELYLNVVELGDGVFGVEAAAHRYWQVSVSALGPRRAAELAATLPSPREDNPATRTPRFRWRAELIFERAFGGPPDAGAGGDVGAGIADTSAADTARPRLPSPGPARPDSGTASGPRDTAAGWPYPSETRTDTTGTNGASEPDSSTRQERRSR